MKVALTALLLLCASPVENYANEADTNRFSTRSTVTFVYRASREQAELAIKNSATNLWRVEVAPGGNKAVIQEWKSKATDIPRENTVRADLNYRGLKFFWMPPKVNTRKVSEGGRIAPLQSPIWITVGSLKTNNSMAFVTLSRDLKQSTTLHIPYTEIPAGRGTSSVLGVYHTDVQWLRNLLGTNPPLAEFVGAEFFDPEVIQVLRGETNSVKSATKE